MKILVRSVDSKVLCLDVQEDTTVEEIKNQMEVLGGIPAEEQTLTLNNIELENDSTVDLLKLTEGVNLDLNLKLLGGVVASDVPEHLRILAYKYKVDKMICRKCYARLPLGAKNCRKRKCGHSSNIRPKKKIKDKEGKK